MNFADMTNQLPMLSAKNPSLMRGARGGCDGHLFVLLILVTHCLILRTLYPTKIFGGKHGEFIPQNIANT